MSTPGYYKSNYRALSVWDVVRRWGWRRLPLYYRITRSKKPSPAGWMPETWAEMECKEEELSAEFFHVAEPYRQAFKPLGFSEVGFKKLKRVLNPLHRYSGGINFLDGSRRHYAQLRYVKLYAPPPINRDRKTVVVSFTAVFREKTVSYANKTRSPFEAVENHEVFGVATDDVAVIYQRFADHLKRQKEEPRSFPDLQSLQSWFDSDKREVFEQRVRRGYFIPMTDAEVAALRGKLPPVL